MYVYKRQTIYNVFSMRNKVIPKTHTIKYNNISASSYDEKDFLTE